MIIEDTTDELDPVADAEADAVYAHRWPRR
jgi:hypothetical protein